MSLLSSLKLCEERKIYVSAHFCTTRLRSLCDDTTSRPQYDYCYFIPPENIWNTLYLKNTKYYSNIYYYFFNPYG